MPLSFILALPPRKRLFPSRNGKRALPVADFPRVFLNIAQEIVGVFPRRQQILFHELAPDMRRLPLSALPETHKIGVFIKRDAPQLDRHTAVSSA